MIRPFLVTLAVVASSVAAAEPAPLRGVLVTPPPHCLQPRSHPNPQVPHPKVVSTWPATGAVVRPGVLVLSVTFDLPMACEGQFTGDRALANPCPGGERVMILTRDRRTIRTVCQVGKATRYGLWLNQGSDHDFIGLSGWAAESFDLTFATSDAAPVKTLAEAMALNPDLKAPPKTAP